MEIWSESFTNFIGVLLIILLASMFWNSFQVSVKTGNPYLGQAINCPNDYSPVCGSDGLTYENICYITLHHLTPQYDGACKPGSLQAAQQMQTIQSGNNYVGPTSPTLSGQYISQ